MYKLLLFLSLSIFFVGCESYNDKKDPLPSVVGDIVDNVAWYNDVNNDVMLFSVNNPIPNEYKCKPFDDLTAPSRPCTLEDINGDTDPADDYEPLLHVNLSTSDFGLPIDVVNASFKIKGGYTRYAAQKSYSIKLDSKENLLMKQRKFMVTKSQSDASRVQNKLAFDLFRIIPNITSLKVQFVNLKINDVDYGLYNNVEAYRKEYLVNRGWNKDDHLYNAVNFMFKEVPELSLDVNGEPVNEVEFSKILEIKNGKDNSKLIEMLHALNTTTNIDTVIAKYFNRKNLLTWLAINLVINNKDTIQHNFYLYNPLYSDTFYFMPWDYDGAWSDERYLGKNEYGISVWWQSVLFRKFLSVKKNRDDLYAMAEILRDRYITDEFIKNKIAEYEASVRPFQSQAPDNEHNSDNSWVNGSQRLWSSIPANINMYKSVIGDPMPFFMSVEYANSLLNVKWDESIDLEGDTIVYDLKISSDGNFSDNNTTIIDQEDILDLNYTRNIHLGKGTYYIKVISKELNDPTHYQISYEQVDLNNETLYGVIKLEVQ